MDWTLVALAVAGAALLAALLGLLVAAGAFLVACGRAGGPAHPVNIMIAPDSGAIELVPADDDDEEEDEDDDRPWGPRFSDN